MVFIIYIILRSEINYYILIFTNQNDAKKRLQKIIEVHDHGSFRRAPILEISPMMKIPSYIGPTSTQKRVNFRLREVNPHLNTTKTLQVFEECFQPGPGFEKYFRREFCLKNV